MKTGEELVSNMVYYWAEPDRCVGPHKPWEAIRDHNVEMINWSIKQFGIPSSRKRPERWFMFSRCFYFLNKQDRLTFVLKWA